MGGGISPLRLVGFWIEYRVFKKIYKVNIDSNMVPKYLSFPIKKDSKCNQNDIPSKFQNKVLKVIKTMLSYLCLPHLHFYSKFHQINIILFIT